MLSACSSQPEADEPSFADPAAHSSEDEQASLADAPEDNPDSDLAQQIGGDCGARDYALISAQEDTNCAFAMEIYKRAMKATYQLEAPDPSVTQRDKAISPPRAQFLATSTICSSSSPLTTKISPALQTIPRLALGSKSPSSRVLQTASTPKIKGAGTACRRLPITVGPAGLEPATNGL